MADRWRAFLATSRWYGLAEAEWMHAAFGDRPAGTSQHPYPVTVAAYPDGEVRIELPVPPLPITVVGARIDDPRTRRLRHERLSVLHGSCVAAHQHGASRVVAVLSEVPCLRQDRPTPGRLELAAREWVTQLLSLPAFDAVVTWHPKPELAELVSGTDIVVPSLDDIAAAIVAALPPGAVDAVVAPDRGAAALAGAVASRIRCDMYQMGKRRSGPETVVSTLDGSIGRSAGCLIVDDMYVSGGTLAAAVEALRDRSRGVLAYVSDFRPTPVGRKRLGAMLRARVLDGMLVPGYHLTAQHHPAMVAVDTAEAMRSVLLRAAGAGQVRDVAGIGSRHG
jgi:phosphoribosylpyrophosphate synthetase